ncbi:SIS domain-containing protein [Alicyclobacillus fastidiosus]|uniref:Glutamine--fructose-6-phosphate aminotransferase [isomerizing] n=1 Tax=Alicyclobacillus fastidiosus TaxID=392011 RepID=A0ABY6ZBQ2_9BACL|nr:SIS domain-containing protein [Alicyclobacillus fastidiosus]WAH39967.1 SIS domain-containing protein [Alicyclobacillus fastidiosus]GMA61249.1 glucosamine--fructose-6-phosphate aminotransferase [Alicyclobacillus fastidiosus]
MTYLTEILEQPMALSRLYDSWQSSALLSRLSQAYARCPRPLVFVGMGSSHYAPIVIRPRLARAGIPYRMEEAGEVLHYERDTIAKESWVIAISQSGESYETRELAKFLEGRVERVIAITNEPQSTLAHVADDVLLLGAGVEAGSTTKTFLSTCFGLHMLVDALSGEELVTRDIVMELQRVLETKHSEIAKQAEEMISFLDVTSERVPHPIHLVARGPMMATALQSALILAETTDLFACALSGGSFRHGPFELVGPGHRAIFFAPDGATQHLVIKMALEVHKRGSKVVVVGDFAGHLPFPQIHVPSVSEEWAPLLYFLPMELFGYAVALWRGRIPGMMTQMGKVTAVE